MLDELFPAANCKAGRRLGILRWWSHEHSCPSLESNPMGNTTIMSWNVRGLNDRARRDVVRKLVDNIRPSMVCLQETKLDVISQYLVFAMLGMSFADFACLHASNTRGGVLVTAREADISLSDVHVGCYSITVRVHPCAQANGDEASWWFTSVYRPQDDNNKILFLKELEAIRDACLGPWAVCRDFQPDPIGGGQEQRQD